MTIFLNSPSAANDFASSIFNLDLVKNKLSIYDIESQNLDDLKISLDKVDSWIEKNNSSDDIKVKFASKSKGYKIVKDDDYDFQISIIPTLLDVKKIIVDRINDLETHIKTEEIKSIADEIDDESIRDRIEYKLIELLKGFELEKETAREIENKKYKEEEKQKLERERQLLEILEKKSVIIKSLIERESVATILGALLITIFSISILISMFNSIDVTEIVKDSFLLLLGYFFGQNSSRLQK